MQAELAKLEMTLLSFHDQRGATFYPTFPTFKQKSLTVSCIDSVGLV